MGQQSKKTKGVGFLEMFSLDKAYDDFVPFSLLRSGDDRDEIVKEWKTRSRGGEGGLSLYYLLSWL